MADRSSARPFSLSAVWDDAGRMLRANAGLLSAIAGFFLLLPATLIARYLPPPARNSPVEQWLGELGTYLSATWLWQLLAAVVSSIGVIAMYLLLLGERRATVALALRRALTLVPGFLAVSLIVTLAASFGFMLLIVPGLYLLGRLILASPAVIADVPNAPLAAVQRAWALSRGRAWSILAMLVIVYAVATIVSMAVLTGFGSLLLLVAGPGGVVLLLLALLQGVVSAAFGVVLTVIIAALYRALRGG